MLDNQLNCQYEPHVAALSYKSPMNILHHAALTCELFAGNNVAIRFGPLPTEAGA